MKTPSPRKHFRSNSSTSRYLLLGLGAALLLASAAGFLRKSAYGCGPLLLKRYSIPHFSWQIMLLLAGGLAFALAMSLEPRRLSGVVQSLLLIGFGLAFSLFGLEAFLRATNQSPSINDLRVTNHNVVGIWNKPNHTIRHSGIEFSNEFVTDENGIIIRGSERDTSIPNALRVMMLGDSFLEGLQVPADENLSVLLQERLEELDSAQDYDVLNLGKAGASPLRYLLLYRLFAPAYQPDVVIVLLYVGNDFTDDAVLFHSDRVLYDESGEILALKPEINLETGEAWSQGTGEMEALEVREHQTVRSLYSVGLVKDRFIAPMCARLHRQARESGMTLPPAPQSLEVLSFLDAYERYALRNQTLVRDNNLAIFKARYQPEDEEDIERTLGYLATLHDEAIADGSQFLLVIVPRPGQVSNQSQPGVDPVIESTAPQELTMAFCEELAIWCIDLLPTLEEHSDQALYWRTDVHFGPAGHDLVARELAAVLLDNEP